jgi:hypothetical protein
MIRTAEFSRPVRRLATGAVVCAVAVVAACSSSANDVAGTGPNASVIPSSITLDSGDSTTVTIVSNGTGTVRWTSSNPAVVTVDSLVLIGDPAKVRARSRGSAQLNGAATINGVTYQTTVPVRVPS